MRDRTKLLTWIAIVLLSWGVVFLVVILILKLFNAR